MKSILIGVEYREDTEIADGTPPELYTPGREGGGFGPVDQGEAVFELGAPAADSPFDAMPEPAQLPEEAPPFESQAQDEVSTTLDDEPAAAFPEEMSSTDSAIIPPTAEPIGIDHFEGVLGDSDEVSLAEPFEPVPDSAHDVLDDQAPMPLAEKLEGTPPIREREVPPEMEPAPTYDLDMTNSKAFEELLALKEDDDTGEFELGGDFADLLSGAEVTAVAEPVAAPPEQREPLEPRSRRDETHTYGPEEMARLAAIADAATKRPPSDPGFEAPPVTVVPETPGSEQELAAEFGLLLDSVATTEGQPGEPVEAIPEALAEALPEIPVDVEPDIPVEAIPEMLVEAALEAGGAPTVDDEASDFAEFLGGPPGPPVETEPAAAPGPSVEDEAAEFAEMFDRPPEASAEAAPGTAPEFEGAVDMGDEPTEMMSAMDPGVQELEGLSKGEIDGLLDGTFDEDIPPAADPAGATAVAEPIVDLEAPTQAVLDQGMQMAQPEPGVQEKIPTAPPGEPVLMTEAETQGVFPEVPAETPAEGEVDGSEDTAEEESEGELDGIEGVESSELDGLMGVLGEDWDDEMEIDE